MPLQFLEKDVFFQQFFLGMTKPMNVFAGDVETL